MRVQKKEFFYLSNLLTLSRILLFPVIFFCLTREYIFAAVVLGATALTTDILDGIIARRLGQISELGKIVDPLADKFGIALFTVYAVMHREFPVWAAVLILGRDLIIVGLGVIYSKKTNLIPVSNMWGKLAAFGWGLLLLVYLVRWDSLKPSLLAICIILVGVSVFLYGRRFILAMRER
ncbi:MAG: CDP-alcohol phosphatidyltransferase family protein [candidate division Zixibacteria bacterium]|nr:CDP-alcohol phosphatidyltransferase family protein [candidate division Zixibacteria bacterium]